MQLKLYSQKFNFVFDESMIQQAVSFEKPEYTNDALLQYELQYMRIQIEDEQKKMNIERKAIQNEHKKQVELLKSQHDT